ncbi:MAG: ADP-ribosylglycohydrolase family protein [Deltaproteobacteria bacterium]|jgi:ADP-ribosylglycohydrolase|nr:ADP-ribosylglycohydrolase family protein [Deltaproteobacteria bacterium]
MMNAQARAMLLASFVGDALSLGVHWIYNTNVIDKKWGRVENYLKPERPTYHPTKDLGDFTHYGDQTLVLLESVAENSGYSLNHFATSWQDFFKNYDGYFDGATKDTLDNLAAGRELIAAGSGSDDLAGAARIAPLVYCYRNDEGKLIQSVRSQAAFTHNNPEVIDSAEIFARAALQVLDGQTPVTAIKQVVDDGFSREPYTAWVQEGLQSATVETRQAMLDFGQMCEVESAFPCVIHLVAKYEKNLSQALIENAMAGGDSAGRGLIAGMVLGAHLGLEAIPPRWLTELKAHDRIVELMNTMGE